MDHREALKEGSDSGLSETSDIPPRQRSTLLKAALAVVVLAVAIAAVSWMNRSRPPAAGPVLTRLTADSGLTTDPALSPDGKLVAYASDRSGEGNLDIWVQQVAGGEPIRLTRDSADDVEPSFSPDGSKIAFHSEREGGGVYVMSALGGEPSLIARQGRRPRFSPDGKQIAYWVGVERWSPAAPGAGKIFVVSAEGGPARQIQPDFDAARLPVWSPDGKRLLFLGLRDSRVSILDNYDWWITPVEGRTAIKSGAYDAFRKHFRIPWEGDPPTFTVSTWMVDPERISFAGPSGATTNVWQIGLSSRTGKVTGSPQQLTFGTAMEVHRPSLRGLPDKHASCLPACCGIEAFGAWDST